MAVLTIGIPTHSDYTGLYFTLLFFRRAIAEQGLESKVKLLVVDNKPAYGGDALRKMVEGDFQARYAVLHSPESTGAPRDLLVHLCDTDWILVVDSHVELEERVDLKTLVEWCDGNPSKDLHHGICMSSRLTDPKTNKRVAVWTHWNPVHGRDGLFGTSALAQLLVDNPRHPAMRIVISGCGLFLTRKDSFIGFHPEQTGFGAEGWLPLRYYEEGRSVWVEPWLRFFHCFRPKTVKVPYDVRFRSIATNQLRYVRDLKPNPFLTYSGVKLAMRRTDRVDPEIWNDVLASLGKDEAWFQERQLPEQIQRDIEAGGPGTELYYMLKSLGIESPPGCACRMRMGQMNAWGSAGCIANRETVLVWLREGQEQWGWKSYLAPASLALLTGLAFKLSWTDPIPDLLDEAIRRATAKGM